MPLPPRTASSTANMGAATLQRKQTLLTAADTLSFSESAGPENENHQCSAALAAVMSWHTAMVHHVPGLHTQGMYSVLHLQALKVYPRSATLAGLLADCERRAHTASRLRRELGLMCKETAAVALWLLALRSEALLPAGAHRVQVRAVAISGRDNLHAGHVLPLMVCFVLPVRWG